MPRFSAADLAKLPAHIREQIDATGDKPKMDVAERARQQWKPKEAQSVAEEYAALWRSLTPDQRTARMLSARLRDAQNDLHDRTLAEYERLTSDATGRQVARLLADMIERLEPLR